MLFGMFVGTILFLGGLQLRHTHTDAKLLAAFVTLEDQRLAFSIFRHIKNDVMVAFRTTYSLHVLSCVLLSDFVNPGIGQLLVPMHLLQLAIGFGFRAELSADDPADIIRKVYARVADALVLQFLHK